MIRINGTSTNRNNALLLSLRCIMVKCSRTKICVLLRHVSNPKVDCQDLPFFTKDDLQAWAGKLLICCEIFQPPAPSPLPVISPEPLKPKVHDGLCAVRPAGGELALGACVKNVNFQTQHFTVELFSSACFGDLFAGKWMSGHNHRHCSGGLQLSH